MEEGRGLADKKIKIKIKIKMVITSLVCRHYPPPHSNALTGDAGHRVIDGHAQLLG
jgi:hypothetical protein